MEEKYIKFYKTFHKKFKNDKNLIHCSNLVSDRRVVQNSELRMMTLRFNLEFSDYSLAYDE